MRTLYFYGYSVALRLVGAIICNSYIHAYIYILERRRGIFSRNVSIITVIIFNLLVPKVD